MMSVQDRLLVDCMRQESHTDSIRRADLPLHNVDSSIELSEE